MPAMAQESHSPVQSLLGHRKCQTILLVNRMGRGGGGGRFWGQWVKSNVGFDVTGESEYPYKNSRSRVGTYI